MSLNELIAACEDACGRPAIINQMPMQPGDVPRTSADVSKARRLLGFEPHTTVGEGVRKAQPRRIIKRVRLEARRSPGVG